MVFDLNRLLPKEQRKPDDAALKEYAEYYMETLPKFGYIRDAENAATYDYLIRYFAHWYAASQGECDYPEKGLFVFGTKGTGKTMAMQIFSGLFKIDWISIEDLTIAFTVGKEAEFWKMADDYKGQRLIIDDVCNEREVKAYGNTIPLYEFFKKRWEMWRYDGVHTFFTSNAKSRNEITKMYGDTITSRFLGSCNFIELSGRDRRIARTQNKPAVARQVPQGINNQENK